jgi:penicillin-binding protein 2
VESRLRTAFLILLVGFLGISLRLFQLQAVDGARYRRMSEQNRVRRIIVPAPRGKIFDRNGTLLADSKASFSILLVPAEADRAGVEILARILNLTTDDIWDRLNHAESPMTPVRLRRDADFALVSAVEEHSYDISGVVVKTEPQRYYPFGPLFAHVLGYVNEITDAGLARDTTYRQGNIVGVAGLEARYEPLLRGHDGSKYVVVNAWGKEVSELPEREETSPLPGQELHLTLDAGLQQKAADLLEPYAKAVAVGIDLRDGGILCLYSKPGFDPNLLSGTISQASWDSLASDPATPFVNRATMSLYSPGSTVKPLCALAALDRGAVDEHTTFEPCTGVFTYGHQKFKCTGVHGRLTLIPAIAQSCNIYFYQLGLRTGLDALCSEMTNFGFGSPTGIDLPTERNGTVPTRAWLDQHYGPGKWPFGDVLNIVIGQGEVQVTPLQLANCYAMLAGSGDYHVPHLLDCVKSNNGSPTTDDGRRMTDDGRRHISLDPDHLRLVHDALAQVVLTGTGTSAQIPGVAVSGKTGTTEHTGGEDHAWFACYAGRPTPEAAFVVLIENGGHGGVVAAPIARGLIAQYFGIPIPAPVAETVKTQPVVTKAARGRRRTVETTDGHR